MPYLDSHFLYIQIKSLLLLKQSTLVKNMTNRSLHRLYWIWFQTSFTEHFLVPYIYINETIVSLIYKIKMSFLYITFLSLTALLGYGMTYPLSQFYPFGSAAGDRNLPANDDQYTSSIPLSVQFPFFGSNYSSVFVSFFFIISLYLANYLNSSIWYRV